MHFCYIFFVGVIEGYVVNQDVPCLLQMVLHVLSEQVIP